MVDGDTRRSKQEQGVVVEAQWIDKNDNVPQTTYQRRKKRKDSISESGAFALS